MTSRELTFGIYFWSRFVSAWRWYASRLPTKFGANTSIQFGVIDWHFPISNIFGSNICYSHWDRRTYAPDVHLMTSRELTFGFDCWSRGHLRTAVTHLPTKFGAYGSIQFEVIDIFPKSKMAAAVILDFQNNWIWHVPSAWWCGACALYLIGFKYML